MKIPLTQGYEATLCSDGYEYASQFKWHAVVYRNPDGSVKLVYAARRIIRDDGSRTTLLMHRELAREFGILEEDKLIDHVNNDGLDNRLENLRPATRSQNRQNSTKRGGKSKYKGVNLQPKTGRWFATIMKDYQRYHLGTYATEEEAYEAYCRAAKELHGEFARLQ